MVVQLQTLLSLRAGCQPGRRDPLRNLSQVHPWEAEGLHCQGKNKCGAWLAGRDWGVCNCCCRGWGLFSRVSFPLAEIIWQLKISSRWCSVPLLEAAHHSKLFSIFYSSLRTGSSSYGIMFGETQHMQNVPSLWFKRYNEEYPLTDKVKFAHCKLI